jgi:hypothetical protein
MLADALDVLQVSQPEAEEKGMPDNINPPTGKPFP